VLARIELLKKFGPTLDYPYTSQIEGKLREARLRIGKTRFRVLYFFDEDRTAFLLHGFTKNAAAVEEIDNGSADLGWQATRRASVQRSPRKRRCLTKRRKNGALTISLERT